MSGKIKIKRKSKKKDFLEAITERVFELVQENFPRDRIADYDNYTCADCGIFLKGACAGRGFEVEDCIDCMTHIAGYELTGLR